MLTSLQILFGWSSKILQDEADLFLLILSCKQWISEIKLCQQASKAPNINGKMIFCAEDYLRSTVKSRLDVQEIGLMNEHTCAEVDDLYAYFRVMLHQHVFGFEVTMNDAKLFEESQ